MIHDDLETLYPPSLSVLSLKYKLNYLCSPSCVMRHAEELQLDMQVLL